MERIGRHARAGDLRKRLESEGASPEQDRHHYGTKRSPPLLPALVQLLLRPVRRPPEVLDVGAQARDRAEPDASADARAAHRWPPTSAWMDKSGPLEAPGGVGRAARRPFTPQPRSITGILSWARSIESS